MRMFVRLALCSVIIFAWLSLVAFEAPIKADANTSSNIKASKEFRILTFNILQAGGNAANVGFDNKDYGGSRMDEIVEVIKNSKADVIGLQELYNAGPKLLKAMGNGWYIKGTVLSKHPIQILDKGDHFYFVCRINRGKGKSVVIINSHWWPRKYGPSVIGKLARESKHPKNIEKFRNEIAQISVPAKGKRGYLRTTNAIKKYLAAGDQVFVVGDFNECSDLDWTNNYEANGKSRAVSTATGNAITLAVPWIGSKKIRAAGLKDAYRQIHKNEVKNRGDTWTAKYPEITPGRSLYSEQILTRIDFIYFGGQGVKVKDAAVIGEDKSCEIIYPRKWPSDHRAVLGIFELSN